MSSPSSAGNPSRSPCAATVSAERGDVQVPNGATVTPSIYRFFDDLRPPLRGPFFFGTFAPASRASERPIAIACLRLLTRLPDRPLFSVPRLRSRIARSTFSPAFLPYLAMHTLHTRSAAACVFYAEPPNPRTFEPSNPRTLRSVANDAPRLDVARHAADREARLIAEASGKFD